ncbi:MAG: complex I subunit 1 family protein [Promethearchaeota archaeon]
MQDTTLPGILFQFIIFPGLLFILIGALFVDYFDRKMFARGQKRYGPVILQPIYDLLKLLAKENITPEGVGDGFTLAPALQLIIAFLIAFFVPVYTFSGIISFSSDLIFIFFLITIYAGLIFIVGYSSRNPLGLMGAMRAASAYMGFAIPFACAILGTVLITGSLQISNITKDIIPGIIDNPVYVIPLGVLFVIAIVSATVIFEEVPFDVGHAETEIASGWTIELTGRSLAFVRLGSFVLKFALAGIIAAVFLGGPWGLALLPGPQIAFNSNLAFEDLGMGSKILSFIYFLIKILVVLFLITMMRTLQGRIRVDQLIRYFWRYFLPVSLLGLLGILSIRIFIPIL